MYAGVSHIAHAAKNGTAGSRVLGINLEGPFISPNYGAQPAEHCLEPDERVYHRFLELADGNLKVMTVAPELPGSAELIRFLVENRIVAAIGHTGATAKQALRALDAGARLATHAFNAFAYPEPAFEEIRPNKVCGARKAGALELLLASDDVYAEAIADREGLHVPGILLRLLAKCKAPDRLITVTDNLSAAGMPDGQYHTPDGRPYTIDTTNYDVIWMHEKKVIGGVLYRLKDGIMNLARHAGLSFLHALRSATVNPATLLGIDDRLGSIQVGKLADLAVLDERHEVCLTVVGGQVVYSDGLAPT
jgi:N-acetylglucosamine-6-phosphate deacetylase